MRKCENAEMWEWEKVGFIFKIGYSFQEANIIIFGEWKKL